ncbi:COG1361 S-layer family protein [Christensenella tenuis]|uniref:CARDB domain-containing protein n=1 Tax=Christensenella tenuis TaxID=2763033 RepID=A0ABR7EI21_9FIRM|nr:hypothetical protein [Christensenella tenuis]MBC5648654.1 hypothetical protein [Christensenella tenuis]
MKKRITLIALIVILAFSFALPTALAADMRGTALRIDSKSQYEGMNATYQNGYSPAVSGGAAHIILPLVPGPGTEQVKDKEQVNISVNLGDPSTAPFVFNNYDTAVSFEDHKLADGKTKQSYLVNLNLPLAENRVNGNYPVVITAKYPLVDGTIKTQEFTVFVKVTDGKDPSEPAPEPSGEPSGQPTEEPGTDPGTDPGIDPGTGGGDGGSGVSSQPKVIISNYEISPDPVNAGEKFAVKVTLTNTSKKTSVKNITVTFKSQTTDLMPGDNTNTAYIEKIGPKKTADFSFTMEARADAKAGPQKIDIAIAYEDSQAAQLTAADEISVEVHQKIRLEYDPPKFPSEVYMGDTTSASLNLYNKGKNTLYNVTVVLDVPGLTPESSAFLGNMESGTAKTADIYASVAQDLNAGMDGMDGAGAGNAEAAPAADAAVIGGADEPTSIVVSGESAPVQETGGIDAADSVQPGPVEGNFVVTYEDEYGEEYEMKVPVETILTPMPDYGGMDPGEELPPEEPAGFPWWGWVLIAGAAAAVVITVVVKKKKKKRAQELSEDLEDDDIY